MTKIVVGNESCDIDSLICSYVLASILKTYFSIKIQFSLFKLKKELIFLVKHFNFNMSFFRKKISAEDELYLVDHNRSDGNKILGIVDHHKREVTYENLEFEYIEETGSCASLIFKYFSVPKNLYPLIYIAVAMDTNCGTDMFKTTELDKQTMERTKFNFSIEYLFQLKQDYSNLNISEILSLDYKKIDQYGISVIYMANITKEDIAIFKREKKVENYFIMILDKNDRYIVSTDLPSSFLDSIMQSSFFKNDLKFVKHSQKITRKNIISHLKTFHGRRSDC